MKPADASTGKNQADKRQLLVRACMAVVVVIAVLVGIALWQGRETADTDDKSRSAQVIKKVGELYFLPDGEEPTVASIQDTNQLKEQAFFEDAKNGDYLLVYNKAKLALIYRESADKLVNVGPVNPQADGANQSNDSKQ